MKIVNNLQYFENREKPVKLTKVKENPEANHLSKTKCKTEKDYDYYKCDYCGSEIKITKKWEEKTGGIIDLPQSLTKRSKITLCLCHKCINPVMKEFEMRDI